jgi:hypothetical protein
MGQLSDLGNQAKCDALALTPTPTHTDSTKASFHFQSQSNSQIFSDCSADEVNENESSEKASADRQSATSVAATESTCGKGIKTEAKITPSTCDNLGKVSLQLDLVLSEGPVSQEKYDDRLWETVDEHQSPRANSSTTRRLFFGETPNNCIELNSDLTQEIVAKHTIESATNKILEVADQVQQPDVASTLKEEVSNIRDAYRTLESTSSSSSGSGDENKRQPTPRTDGGQSARSTETKQSINIKEINCKDASNKFRNEICDWADIYGVTEEVCLHIAEELLSIASENGATILVHAPWYEVRKLRDRSTDADEMAFFNHLCQCKAKTISKNSSADFKYWHREFCMKRPDGTDQFPKDYHVEELRGKRTDGFFAISSSGEVCLAAMVFANNRRRAFVFEGKGSRHKAALDIALKLKHCIVFVKSDEGTLHILTAGSARRGEAYCLSAATTD